MTSSSSSTRVYILRTSVWLTLSYPGPHPSSHISHSSLVTGTEFNITISHRFDMASVEAVHTATTASYPEPSNQGGKNPSYAKKTPGLHLAALPAEWVDKEWSLQTVDLGVLDKGQITNLMGGYDLPVSNKTRATMIKELLDYSAAKIWTNLDPQATKSHKYSANPSKPKPKRQGSVWKRRDKEIEKGLIPKSVRLSVPARPAAQYQKIQQSDARRQEILDYVDCVTRDHPPLPQSQRLPPVVQSDREWKAELSAQMSHVSNVMQTLAHPSQGGASVVQQTFDLVQCITASGARQPESSVITHMLEAALVQLRPSGPPESTSSASMANPGAPSASRLENTTAPLVDMLTPSPFVEESCSMDVDLTATDNYPSAIAMDMCPGAPRMTSWAQDPDVPHGPGADSIFPAQGWYSPYQAPNLRSDGDIAASGRCPPPLPAPSSAKESVTRLPDPVTNGILDPHSPRKALENLIRHWDDQSPMWAPEETWLKIDGRFVPIASYWEIYQGTTHWEYLSKVLSKWKMLYTRYTDLGENKFWRKYAVQGEGGTQKVMTVKEIYSALASEVKADADKILAECSERELRQYYYVRGHPLVNPNAIVKRHKELMKERGTRLAPAFGDRTNIQPFRYLARLSQQPNRFWPNLFLEVALDGRRTSSRVSSNAAWKLNVGRVSADERYSGAESWCPPSLRWACKWTIDKRRPLLIVPQLRVNSTSSRVSTDERCSGAESWCLPSLRLACNGTIEEQWPLLLRVNSTSSRVSADERYSGAESWCPPSLRWAYKWTIDKQRPLLIVPQLRVNSTSSRVSADERFSGAESWCPPSLRWACNGTIDERGPLLVNVTAARNLGVYRVSAGRARGRLTNGGRSWSTFTQFLVNIVLDSTAVAHALFWICLDCPVAARKLDVGRVAAGERYSGAALGVYRVSAGRGRGQMTNGGHFWSCISPISTETLPHLVLAAFLSADCLITAWKLDTCVECPSTALILVMMPKLGVHRVPAE
ncbi:hypothetical protein K438DRAFT_1749622 [Mycena galopus ATCC 62051]|nr:hypothetical protein K438DRAFT_1749622 [Mycena galopus ATCC 62051]